MLSFLSQLGMPETGYILCAGLSAIVGMQALRLRQSHTTIEVIFWFGLAGLLVLLAIFKESGLQVTIASHGRDVAKEEGWYVERREVLAHVATGLALATSFAVLTLLLVLGDLRLRLGLSVLSVGALLCFVAIRALSLHQIDALLYRRFVAGEAINLVLESLLLAGVILTTVIALLAKAYRQSQFDEEDDGDGYGAAAPYGRFV